MKLERRVPLPWLIAGAVVACAWCSLLSGLGGWFMARDMASRERTLLETEIATRDELPPLGVLVTRLDRVGPAASAGVARGDLIVAIEGVHIEDARDLRDQLRSYSSGDVVTLTVLRERAEEDVAVRLDPFPGDGRRPYLGIYFTARGDEPADL